MSKKDVNQLVKEAAEALDAGMDEAAAIAVVAVEKYGAAMRTFCKDATKKAGIPGAWQALYGRARRIAEQTRRSGSAEAAPRTGWTDNERGHLRGAKSMIRRDPNLVYDLLKDPEVNEAITEAVLTGSGKDDRRGQPDHFREARRELELMDFMGRVALTIEKAMAALPDYVPDADSREQAEMDANLAETYAQFLRAWAKGKNVADEVEAFLAGD